MAIALTCDCGKKLNVKDELEGKRIKCPKCQSSLLVESASNDDDDGDEEETPKKKSGKKEQKKGGGMALYAAVGAVVVLLGCCCLGGAGTGGYFMLNGGGSPLEAKIVGKWTAEVPPPKKGANMTPDDIMKMAFAGSHIEFKADKTVIDATPMTPILLGKWKTVGSKADVITVELSQGPISRKLDIKVVSNDALKITPADSKSEYDFKRAK
ncbi:MAG TPA: hypothetical protein VFE62_04420 [Gemmataceae bacterium]|nr:hypothetical protein [Gemmataceae bacterium]